MAGVIPQGGVWPGFVTEFGKLHLEPEQEFVCSLEVALPGSLERWALTFYSSWSSEGIGNLWGVLHQSRLSKNCRGADKSYSECMAHAVGVEDAHLGDMWLLDRAFSSRFAQFAPQSVLAEGKLSEIEVTAILRTIRERVSFRHPNLNHRRAGSFLVDPVTPEVYLAPCPEGRHSTPIVCSKPPTQCVYCAMPKYEDPLLAQPAAIATTPTLGDRILAGFLLLRQMDLAGDQQEFFRQQYVELRVSLQRDGFFDTDCLEDIPETYLGLDLTWPLYRCDFYTAFRAPDGFWWNEPDSYIVRDDRLAATPLRPRAEHGTPKHSFWPSWLHGLVRVTPIEIG